MSSTCLNQLHEGSKTFGEPLISIISIIFPPMLKAKVQLVKKEQLNILLKFNLNNLGRYGHIYVNENKIKSFIWKRES